MVVVGAVMVVESLPVVPLMVVVGGREGDKRGRSGDNVCCGVCRCLCLLARWWRTIQEAAIGSVRHSTTRQKECYLAIYVRLKMRCLVYGHHQ